MDRNVLKRRLDRIKEPSFIVREALLGCYKEPGGRVSIETVIGAAAALTGEFALRAIVPEFRGDDKWIITGDHINGLLFEEPSIMTVWQVLTAPIMVHAGGTKADLPDWANVCRRQMRAMGKTFFPDLKVDPHYYPHEWSPEACPRFRENITKLAADHSLTPYETALALGGSTGELIMLGKDVLPVKIGMQLAADIMKGVSYMVPWSKPEDLSHPMAFSHEIPNPSKKVSVRTDLLLRPKFEWRIG